MMEFNMSFGPANGRRGYRVDNTMLNGRKIAPLPLMNPVLLDFPESFETERLVLSSARSCEGAAIHAAIAESITELRPWMPWPWEVSSCEETEVKTGRPRPTS